MKQIITFTKFVKMTRDGATGELAGGEFRGSFSQEVEGDSIAQIIRAADSIAKKLSADQCMDVKVSGIQAPR